MFNENSYIVKVWVKNVKSGRYTREQIPDLSNLREIVSMILDAY